MIQLVVFVAGLSMFLLGMKMMSEGLEKAAGNKLRYVLEKLTRNKYVAVIVGTIVTGIIHSSSATSVLLIGFVNSGLMELKQAMWVIMGANIGTTVTGQLIAIDMGVISPYIIGVGIMIVIFFKKEGSFRIGEILVGVGMLFMAMDVMAYAMRPLQNSNTCIEILATLKNPLIALLVGTIFTALIQSSTASIGILQTLAMQGLVPISVSIWIVYGQNIGTCITAYLASLNGCRNAKRVTIIHILVNVLGMLVFIPICYFLPMLSWIVALTPANPASQIANLHTIFNIVSTVALLPVDGVLIKLSYWCLPKRQGE